MNNKLKLRLSESMLLTALLTGPSSVALADPLVGAGGKPGVATAWSEKGGAVSLVIGGEFDPAAVAQAISAGVPGASAKVSGKEVVVSGMTLAQLLPALEKVEVGKGDDIDAMLSAIQQPGGKNEEGSGSSIRATQAADFSDVMGDKSELIVGKVTEVKRERYPLVLVSFKIAKAGAKGPAEAKKGALLTILPRVQSKNGVVNFNDKASKLNVGAWYIQPGDTIAVRLEAEKANGVFVASAVERQK